MKIEMKMRTLFFKRWAAFAVALYACSTVFAQIHITNQTGLENIKNDLAGSYILDNDITLTGDWTPLGTFTGTLDGNEHVIFNLTIAPRDMAAFFTRIQGGTVKNLGFENASVIDDTHARTAILAGYVNGNAVIENCYVANSTVGGRWCVGSFAGRAEGAATIRNCYSSAYLYTPDFNGGAGHTGGIIGNIFADGVTVENCYFSGIIQRILGNGAEGQVAGIIGWNGKGGPNQSNVSGTIKNNVNLAPYLLSNYAKNRIASSCQGQAGGEPTPGPNYSLSTTIVSGYGNWGNTTDVITTGTTTNKDGEDITSAVAKTQSFYEGLGWNFTAGTGIWEIATGGSYPKFLWADNTRPHFVGVPITIPSVQAATPVDLSKYIFSGRGLPLTFSSASTKISISGSTVSFAATAVVNAIEQVTVQVQEGDLLPKKDLEITLLPNVIHITSQADLAAIGSVLNANYVLDNDITLSGTWTPVGTETSPFTGTLDGQNHVIYGLTIPQNASPGAFFGCIRNAHIQNLGFENANVVTTGGTARTAVLAGFMEGAAVIENCYVANSTVGGRWCVGSLVGRARNITDGGNAAIRNCYSSAYLYAYDLPTDGTGHVGGIIGNIYDGDKITVENCYFSGVIKKELASNAGKAAEGQVAGIIGWIGNDGGAQLSNYVIQNNVNLAPYLLSNNGKHRISSTRGDAAVNDPTPGPNYSLSTTVVSGYDGWENTPDVITTGTAENKDGEDITPTEAKTQSFYTGLGWDFTAGTGIWEMSAGYPVFAWENNAAHFVTPNQSVDLACETTVDLSKYIFSGRGLALTFETADADIDVTTAGVVSYAKAVATEKTATVTVKETGYTETASITVNVAVCTSTSVVDVKTVAKRVVGQWYFDLTGRPVSKAAAKGILIQKSLHEDGTTSYGKVDVK